MNLYFPPGWRKADRRPAIVFFFGGSCAPGSPAQFASTAAYFAARGLVAASAEYRIAAFAAYNTTFTPDDEDTSVSSSPNALVLVNPAFGFPDRGRLTPEQAAAAEGPIGAFVTSWKVTSGGPPAILFFGTEDPLQEKARDFARQLITAGTRAEFYTAEGQGHGFFNRSDGSPWHTLVLRQIDSFLASLGYLKGDPAVGIPAATTAALQKVRL